MAILPSDPTEREEQLEKHIASTYGLMRERVKDLQLYVGLTIQEVGFAAGWNTSSLSRFMTEKYVTIPHHVALLIEQLCHHYDIEERKRQHAEKLLASIAKSAG